MMAAPRQRLPKWSLTASQIACTDDLGTPHFLSPSFLVKYQLMTENEIKNWPK